MDEERRLNRKFYLEFIALYKSLTALWNTKNPDYHDRRKREEQYEILLQKFREEYPLAGRALLGRRINILRSNLRKEYRRIEKLRAAAIAENANITIEAELWYFEALSFILENDEKKPPIQYTQTMQSKRKLKEELGIGKGGGEDAKKKKRLLRSQPRQPRVKVKMEKNLDRKFYLEFFARYKSLPALWNTSSPDYNNRTKKEIQYAQLLTKYRERYPTACHRDLTKRISILRSNLLKEYRRMEKALEHTKPKSPYDIIETDCWFFEELRFIVEDVDGVRRPFEQTERSKKRLSKSISGQQPKKKAKVDYDESSMGTSQSQGDEIDEDVDEYNDNDCEDDDEAMDEDEAEAVDEAEADVDIDGEVELDFKNCVVRVEQPRLRVKRYTPEVETHQQYSKKQLQQIQKASAPKRIIREKIRNTESSELEPTEPLFARVLDEDPIILAPKHHQTVSETMAPDAQIATTTTSSLQPYSSCSSSSLPKTKLRNEYQNISDIWALKLQRMPRSQQLLAEKFISDILFEGQLGNLTRNSVQIKELPGVEEVFRTYNQNQNHIHHLTNSATTNNHQNLEVINYNNDDDDDDVGEDDETKYVDLYNNHNTY